MTDLNRSSNYHPQAYRSDSIPEQNKTSHCELFLSGAIRLPWCSTQRVSTLELMRESTPENMKSWEKSELEKTINKANGTYVAPIFEHVELHQKYDHEHFRFAQLPLYISDVDLYVAVWKSRLHYSLSNFNNRRFQRLSATPGY
ncbi:hypothetical protein [Pseudomonas avellanae]|uniref:hypothetical protein n=1 Tax=Pseudomonas avellanae TaxID=46257 RepID=UPI001E431F7F|nr:hypothetical protein [Pseudomonas avellanae]UQW69926.1 hypothetical protein L2Y00_05385 [Pseudomonas avellanae]